MLRSQGIENVVIFVCDALRWDYAPEEVMEMGLTFKTIASSLHTGASFPSMVSGLYPPKHGVETWEDVLSRDSRGLLSLSSSTVSLRCHTMWASPPGRSPLHHLLRNPPEIPLNDICAPFIYIEDDKGGHCPYGLSLGEVGEAGCPEFFSEYGKEGREELTSQYRKGLQHSVGRFIERLRTLDDRGLLEKTLVIFTSDHGELLGEYGGLTAHGRPCCPELVYVPTILTHPSLKRGGVVSGGVVRHVDFFPTIAALLGRDLPYDVDGVNLLARDRLPNQGFSFRRGSFFRRGGALKKSLRRSFSYEADSVWDYSGGHVFHRQRLAKSLPFFVYKVISQTNPESHFMTQSLRGKGWRKRIASYREALRHLTFPHLEYMHPGIDEKTARATLDEYLGNVGVVEQEEDGVDIDEEVIERLRALGYID